MGLTHYWERPVQLSPAAFNRAVVDCRRLLPLLSIPLAGGDGTGTPVLDSEVLMFNGVGDASYETCAICRVEEDPGEGRRVFSFCKTEHRPYDLAVRAVLIVFQHHLRSQFKVSSDDHASAWEAARQLCQQHLGYGNEFRLDQS